jgi:ABC-2 type transport system ATP-binding protein
VGPNGAGKTTTFRVLVGLTTPTRGRATISGFDTEHESVAVRRMVGWMPGEERSLLMRLTCRENLRFHGRLQGLKGDDLQARIKDVLSQVGIAHAADHSVFALSSGMRARLQLARALLHRPRVLVLDEPTGPIDPVAAHELLGLIVSIVDEQKLAAVISSHRLEEIEALHSHVILLDRGSLRYDGDLDDLRKIVDRRQLEIEFSSPESASQAGRLIRDAGLGDVQSGANGSLKCLLESPDTTTGSVLTVLGPHVDAIVHLNETKRPLRDILADMYLGGEPQ